jgi:hypothetical protein
MAARPGEYLTISEEHFLEPLGLPELEGALPARRRELYAAIVELLAEDGLIAKVASGSPVTLGQEAELRIPGTPVHVHISAITEPRLNEILTMGAALDFHQKPEIPITLAGLQALWRLVTTLKTEYGERSVVEALGNAKPPSAETVTGILHGAPCRHPGKGCRYMQDGTCTIPGSAVAQTLEHLEGRGVVQRLNAVEPIEYGVTF